MPGSECPMCSGLGWVLDCNDLNKPGPRMAEMLPCFYPECTTSGQPIRAVSFKDTPFTRVSKHPHSGLVMSVSSPE